MQRQDDIALSPDDGPAPPARGPSAGMRQAGMTLLELCLVLSILAITAGWGLPGLSALMARHEVAVEVMRLQDSLTTARHTAISRRAIVTVCPSADGSGCGDDWTAPLSILAGEVGQPPAEQTLLGRRRASRLNAITYRQDQRPVRYRPDGRATGHNGTFRLCGRHGEGASLILSNFGRVRVIGDSPAGC